MGGCYSRSFSLGKIDLKVRQLSWSDHPIKCKVWPKETSTLTVSRLGVVVFMPDSQNITEGQIVTAFVFAYLLSL